MDLIIYLSIVIMWMIHTVLVISNLCDADILHDSLAESMCVPNTSCSHITKLTCRAEKSHLIATKVKV